jgi:hypothetical protein
MSELKHPNEIDTTGLPVLLRIEMVTGNTLHPICYKANELGLKGIKVVVVRMEGGEKWGDPASAVFYGEKP